MRLKTVEDYLKLHYPVTIIPSEAGGYFAKIEDLPGCMTQAETLQELQEMIEDAKRVWIEIALEIGNHIPLPGERSGIRKPQYKIGRNRLLNVPPFSHGRGRHK